MFASKTGKELRDKQWFQNSLEILTVCTLETIIAMMMNSQMTKFAGLKIRLGHSAHAGKKRCDMMQFARAARHLRQCSVITCCPID